ncbi:MAG: hypothetical protein QM805_07850 [Pseudomonas sp.]
MGLFRTIPVDIEAVQFDGIENDEPKFKEMGATLPSWMWRGITKGAITFGAKGVAVNGARLEVGEWIVFDGVFISLMENKKFHETFTRARKPLTEMASAPKSMATIIASTTPEAAPEAAPAEASAVAGTSAPEPQEAPPSDPAPAPMPEPVARPGRVQAEDNADQLIEKMMNN